MASDIQTSAVKMEPIAKNKEFQEQYKEYLKAKVLKIQMLL